MSIHLQGKPRVSDIYADLLVIIWLSLGMTGYACVKIRKLNAPTSRPYKHVHSGLLGGKFSDFGHPQVPNVRPPGISPSMFTNVPWPIVCQQLD